MKSAAANKKLDEVIEKVEKKGLAASKLIDDLKELREFALKEQDPLVTKVLRLTYEFIGENNAFDVQAQYEEDEEGNEYPIEIEDNENLLYFLNLLKNALPDNEDPITVSFNSNHLFVDHGSTQLICRLIDARFPDYKVVIPADNPYRLTVNKHDFQNALRRVNVFSNKSTNQVALNITGNELQMAAQDIDFSFEGNERMKCQYEGEDMAIAFNARFLIEMLSATSSDEVKMELSTPTKAGIIKPVEQDDEEDLLMLVMPLMLNQ
jgi:DNA polymerase III sliding clamp (beta) subunit (PCNA family)